MEHQFDKYDRTYTDEVEKSISCMGPSHDFYIEVKAKKLQDLAIETFDRSSALKMLDVGCGVGKVLKRLADNGNKLYGIDIAEKAVAVARSECPFAHLQAYDGKTVPFADNTFDIVYAICVMHHVPPEERSRLMDEMRRVARPGGLVVIFEHNPFNPLTRLCVFRCEFDRGVKLLPMRHCRELFRRIGMQISKTGYILFFPFRGARWRRVEEVFSDFPLGAQYYAAAVKV